MSFRLATITLVVSPEAEDVGEEEIEATTKVYLKAEDIPFCQRIQKVKVLSNNPCPCLKECFRESINQENPTFRAPAALTGTVVRMFHIPGKDGTVATGSLIQTF